MKKKIPDNTIHGYGPPKKTKPPLSIPGVKTFLSRCPHSLDQGAGLTLLRLNGGYAVKQNYPDLKPGEINFILR